MNSHLKLNINKILRSDSESRVYADNFRLFHELDGWLTWSYECLKKDWWKNRERLIYQILQEIAIKINCK